MEYFLLFICLWLWFCFWSSQAGYSMTFWGNRLQTWQQKIPYGGKIPEIVIALSIAGSGFYLDWKLFEAITAFETLWQIKFGWYFVVILSLGFIVKYLISSLIALGGKESGTWAYLPGSYDGYKKDTNEDGVIDNKDGRMSTLRKWNDWLAGLFGMTLGHKHYAKVWAFTKGFITTFPVFSTGAIFQPITRELTWRLTKNVKGDRNFYMEFFGDGTAYALSCFIALVIGKRL